MKRLLMQLLLLTLPTKQQETIDHLYAQAQMNPAHAEVAIPPLKQGG